MRLEYGRHFYFIMIATTTNGVDFIIDDSDSFLLEDTWHFSSTGYILRNKDLKKIHRAIMNAKIGELVDHRDRNKLNNSRSNLRIATINQSVHNQGKRKNTKTKYKGVQFKKDIKLYESRCRMNGLDFHLGSFTTDYAAAYAYNKKALELSEFACINELDYTIEHLEDVLTSHRRTTPVAEKRSQYKNVYWHKKVGRMKTGKWTIFIVINEVTVHLGRFHCDLEAFNFYNEALLLKDKFNGNKLEFKKLVTLNISEKSIN